MRSSGGMSTGGSDDETTAALAAVKRPIMGPEVVVSDQTKGNGTHETVVPEAISCTDDAVQMARKTGAEISGPADCVQVSQTAEEPSNLVQLARRESIVGVKIPDVWKSLVPSTARVKMSSGQRLVWAAVYAQKLALAKAIGRYGIAESVARDAAECAYRAVVSMQAAFDAMTLDGDAAQDPLAQMIGGE